MANGPSGHSDDVATRIPVALQPILALNAQYVQHLALTSHASCCPAISRIIAAHQESIPNFLKACPFALFDVRFRDSEAWASILDLRTSRNPIVLENVEDNASRMLRAACFLAWNLVRQHSATATLLLGLSQGVINIVDSLDLMQVQRVPAEHPDWLQPRWSEQPSSWEELMLLAADKRRRANDVVRMRAMTLLLGPVIE